MKELVLLVGPMGSGKSTYAKQLETEGYVRISQDDMGKPAYIDNYKSALDSGHNVVMDRCNHLRAQRLGFLEEARKHGYKTRIIVLHVPHSVCEARCNARLDHPSIKTPQDTSRALHMFFTKYERVQNEEADVVERRGWEGARKLAIGSDLDGTLCNIDHRLPTIKNTPKNWKAFFEGIKDDKLNGWCALILEKFEDSLPIVLASGRPDDHREATETWLKNQDVYYDDLFMRRRGDFRPDDIVKEIILEFEIKPRYNLLFMMDDRKRVVEMWRRHGIVCLHCAEGAF